MATKRLKLVDKVSLADFDPHSGGATARAFRIKGETHLGIDPERERFFRALDYDGLVKDGMLGAELGEHRLRDFPLTLKLSPISFRTLPNEWSPQMLKDAAVHLLTLSAKLWEKGLILKSAIPRNVQFENGKPHFVDWGGLRPLKQPAKWPMDQFVSEILLPLYLMSIGRARLAYGIGSFLTRPLSRSDLARLSFGRVSPFRWLSMLKHLWMLPRAQPSPRLFASLADHVQSIDIKHEKTEWTGYEEGYPPMHESMKYDVVHKLLGRLRPETVLDLGCNTGRFARLAAEHGAKVAAMDLDMSAVDRLYQRTREAGECVQPLVKDVCESGLLRNHSRDTERLKCDVVFAFALAHHLVFKWDYSFEDVTELLAAYTGRTLIVEFVAADDAVVTSWMNPRFSWYHREGFVKALGKHFKNFQAFDSGPARVLIMCDKKA